MIMRYFFHVLRLRLNPCRNLFTMYSVMTLLECIQVAKTIQYVPPNKPFDQYTYDEVCYATLYEVLKNDILVYCGILASERHAMVKMLFKASLKDYIKEFGGEHMLPGKKKFKF